MKQSEIKPCASCGEGVMHSNQIVFFEVKFGRRVVDLQAVQRQAGLEMMMGGAAHLASVMGPNEDLAVNLGDDYHALLCMECAVHVSVAELADIIGMREDEKGEESDKPNG